MCIFYMTKCTSGTSTCQLKYHSGCGISKLPDIPFFHCAKDNFLGWVCFNIAHAKHWNYSVNYTIGG